MVLKNEKDPVLNNKKWKWFIVGFISGFTMLGIITSSYFLLTNESQLTNLAQSKIIQSQNLDIEFIEQTSTNNVNETSTSGMKTEGTEIINKESNNELITDSKSLTTTIQNESTLQKESEMLTESQTSSESIDKVASESSNDAVKNIYQMIYEKLPGQYSLYYFSLSQKDSEPLIINNQSIRAASIIKLFILAALYQAVEQNQISLSDNYSLLQADIASGTGDIQNMTPGTEFTVEELAHKMIAISDNTATNVLIKMLGGIEQVQQMINDLGYDEVKLARFLADTNALSNGIDNYVNSSDVGDLLRKIYKKELVSKDASTAMLNILLNQQDKSMLSADLPSNVKVYSKTGNYEEFGVQSDASIIETTNGAFVLVLLSEKGTKAQQIPAMNQLGKLVTENFLKIKGHLN